jgi:hypothetical protein
MVSVHASSVVDRTDRITIGGVMISVHASSVVDRMDRITIGGVIVARVIQWNLSKPKLLQTNLIVFDFTLLYLRRVTDLRVNQVVFIHVLTILRIHIVELLVR